MFNNLMSMLVGRQHQRKQLQPEQTRAGCTMEAMEGRLLMASDYLYAGDVGGSDVRPMESPSLNFTKGSTVGFVIYGK